MKTYHFKMNEETNFKAICGIATNVLGMPLGSLSLRTRKRPIQVARAASAYIAMSEDKIHRNIIAKVLNRDRAVTYHYETMHKKMYATCSIYRNTFNKIYLAYKNIDNAKDIFIDKDFMKKYLLKNGVKESKDPNVTIEVTSGSVTCKIKTSYFDYTNQLEFINIALKEYHFTIKII
tara:strand:- start:282 stop:812 length:531 start_codon:yes stop_codon:yes gene_type:complete